MELEKIVKENQGFVVKVASQYRDKGLDMEELVSEGNAGLVKAAQNFDPSRGGDFLQYAVWHVRESIQKALEHNSEHDRTRSLDAPFVHNSRSNLLGVIENDEYPAADSAMLDEDTLEELQEFISTLEAREQQVVRYTFGIGCQEMTLDEISELLGVSKQRVRDIREKALRKLKHTIR